MPGEFGDEYTQPMVGYYEKRYEDVSDPNLSPVRWRDVVPQNGQLKRILKRLRNKKYKNRKEEE